MISETEFPHPGLHKEQQICIIENDSFSELAA